MNAKEKIMEEFIRQFIVKDCKDISVDSIAENIGMSKRTVYENFSSKNEIIRETLMHFLRIEHENIQRILEEEPNPLKQILLTSFTVIRNASQISVARLNNLKKHYPEIADELIKVWADFSHEVTLKSYYRAQEEGYIFKDIAPEFLMALLLGGEKDPRQKTIRFMEKDFDILQLFSAHLFTIIRGVSTMKGVEICDEYFRQMDKEMFKWK
ncbi:MAG: TetR/AcrR family transcriptional regulator [Bacteroidales bacterium]|nr:TetR/AcrR family transcriptional regulator [Bacteroidales bacterium]